MNPPGHIGLTGGQGKSIGRLGIPPQSMFLSSKVWISGPTLCAWDKLLGTWVLAFGVVTLAVLLKEAFFGGDLFCLGVVFSILHQLFV